MIELEDMRLFRALGVSQSLAAAARLLNLTPPAVTVRLQRIEERMGVRLATRAARGISLTTEGQRLVQEAVEIMERIESIPSRVSGESGGVSGHLRVVAPFGFGRAHLAPLVRDLHRSHPNLAISLILADSPLTAARAPTPWYPSATSRGRRGSATISPPTTASCVQAPPSRAVCRNSQHPSELTQYPWLTLRENDEDVTRLRFTQADAAGKRNAKSVTVRLDGALSSNDGTVVSDWAIEGLGIVERSEWDAARLIATGNSNVCCPHGVSNPRR